MSGGYINIVHTIENAHKDYSIPSYHQEISKQRAKMPGIFRQSDLYDVTLELHSALD